MDKALPLTPLHAAVQGSQLAELFGTPPMVALLQHKWNTYAKRLFRLQLLVYVVFLAVFTTTALNIGALDVNSEESHETFYDESFSKGLLVCECTKTCVATVTPEVYP